MSFLELIFRNVLTRKVRSALTGVAVAMAIMAVFALGVLTFSLRETAISILRTGRADFTVGQKGVSDVIYSSMDEQDVDRLTTFPGVESAVGVLIAVVEVDEDHPFFLELGMEPDELEAFGVKVVEGRPYDRDTSTEIMLGYRAARDFRKGVGDTFSIDSDHYTVVGIFSTGQVFGDSASMLPLTTLQAQQRKPGNVTLAFVRVVAGTDIDALRKRIEDDSPEIATDHRCPLPERLERDEPEGLVRERRHEHGHGVRVQRPQRVGVNAPEEADVLEARGLPA